MSGSADNRPADGPDQGFTELRTARLRIRRFAPSDAASFAAYRSEPEVARYQSWDAPYPLDRAEAFAAEQAGAHPDTPGEWCQLAVIEQAGGAHVGDVALHVDADDPRLVTIGITLSSAVQGGGYAVEAVTALLDYLFAARGKHRVAAECDARNRAAVAVLERIGFRREAHHVRKSWWKGEWTDEYVYALLAEEWPPGAGMAR